MSQLVWASASDLSCEPPFISITAVHTFYLSFLLAPLWSQGHNLQQNGKRTGTEWVTSVNLVWGTDDTRLDDGNVLLQYEESSSFRVSQLGCASDLRVSPVDPQASSLALPRTGPQSGLPRPFPPRPLWPSLLGSIRPAPVLCLPRLSHPFFPSFFSYLVQISLRGF